MRTNSTQALMKMRINTRYLIAFFALLFVCRELHELGHIITGRLICGCWGEYRDFNVISICDVCRKTNPWAVIAGINGPLLSYILMWVGFFLLKNSNVHRQWLGFSLIFANLPFARLFTALIGGGDELGVCRELFNPSIPKWELQIICVISIAAIILPPLWLAFKAISSVRKTSWFIGFLLLPMFADLFIVMISLNFLLKKGILSEIFIFNTPWFIHIVFWTSILTAILLRRDLTAYPNDMREEVVSTTE